MDDEDTNTEFCAARIRDIHVDHEREDTGRPETFEMQSSEEGQHNNAFRFNRQT